MGEEREPLNVDIPRLLMALGVHDIKAQGTEIWAPCPYPDHHEKTPSWSIQLDPTDPLKNGFNYCFGCEENGGPVHLVREVLQVSSYSAAMAWIRDHKLDLDSTPPMRVNFQVTSHNLAGLEWPKGCKAAVPLADWNKVARRYIEDRGIPAHQVARWGLAVGAFGRTRQRIVIPTFDRVGRLLSWTARAYAGQDQGPDPLPRYMHPSGSDRPDPGGVFGEEYWPERPARDTLVICEGGFNAMACERAGAPYVAALSGSKFDKGQLLKISTFGKLLIATDLDTAGTKIAKALSTSLARWKKAKRVQFPKGEDPNDIAIRDIGDLRERLQWANAI